MWNSYRLLIVAATGLLLACTTPPPAPRTPADADHPVTAALPYFALRTDLPVVKLEVDGHGTFEFIIDTGANRSAVYVDSLAAIGAERIAEKDVTVRSLTGASPRPVARLTGLMIGEDRHDDIIAAILPPRPRPPDADGIIGTDILQHYALLFDPAKDELAFIPAESFDREAYASWDLIPISPGGPSGRPGRLWFARTEIRKSEIPVLIDTGADFSIINWAAARLKEDLGAAYDALLRDWEYAGATGVFRPSLALIIDRIDISGHKWVSPRFIVLDLDALSTTLVGDGPLMIMGANMLAGRRFAVDFAGGALLIDPKGPHVRNEEGAPEEAPSVSP